jgi:hypothetical protein
MAPLYHFTGVTLTHEKLPALKLGGVSWLPVGMHRGAISRRPHESWWIPFPGDLYARDRERFLALTADPTHK